MRVLCTVVQVARLTRFHPWEPLTLGGPVALELIGDEHPRHVHQALEQLAEELLRGPLVAPALDQDIEDVPGLLHGPPEIVAFALERQKPFIEVPLVPRPRTAATELISILLAKFAAPLAHGLRRHDHATF